MAPLPTTPPPVAPAVNPRPATLPPPDHRRARRDARRILESLDLTRPVIVLWLPGTNRRGVPVAFSGAAARAWGDRASVAEFFYPASFDVRQGTATGIETMRLVLAGIAAHTGRPPRVHLAGESQGAWVISETLRDPRLRRLVDRAVLLGHPWAAATHYDDGHDPRVMVLNRRTDIVARPFVGEPNSILDAAEGVLRGRWSRLAGLLPALVRNPETALLLAATGIRLLLPGGVDRDPHNYEDVMNGAVAFLRVGDRTGNRG